MVDDDDDDERGLEARSAMLALKNVFSRSLLDRWLSVFWLMFQTTKGGDYVSFLSFFATT